jgi:hypothetical protein
MDKRLEKRHKRQVARAKKHSKLSEPDVRTPEQIQAAREVSRPDSSRRAGFDAGKSAPSFRGSRPTTAGSAAKADS